MIVDSGCSLVSLSWFSRSHDYLLDIGLCGVGDPTYLILFSRLRLLLFFEQVKVGVPPHSLRRG
jgi:hypothetical protein